MVTSERMSEQFEKLHLQVGKFPITLHHFTGPDVDGPHCHPWPLTPTILRGGYIEEFWMKRLDGGYDRRVMARHPGSTFFMPAVQPHRILELLDEECVTSVVWHDQGKRREPRFYRFDENGFAQSRRWDEPDFARSP